MTTLAANEGRAFSDGVVVPRPVVASDIIYEGAALGWSSGYVRPLVSGDKFAGFAVEKIDNSAGAAGDKNVMTRRAGLVKLTVSGAAAGDEGQAVYATDDDTFLVTGETGSRIGVIDYIDSSGVALVRIETHDVENAQSAGGVFTSASWAIGAEGSNAIVASAQLLDANGNDCGRVSGLGYLSSDANGDNIVADAATLTVTSGTDGDVEPLAAADGVGSLCFFWCSESDGDLDITVTDTSGAATHYLVLILPNGKRAVSSVLTFAA